MREQGARRARAGVIVGLVVGLGLGLAPGCAGKGKGSRSPEQCMTRCEQDECAYNPDSTANDEYLECLDACAEECA